MAEQTLGLDIGLYSIKAALFESSFTKSKLLGVYESPPLNLASTHTQDEIDSIQQQAILNLIQKHDLQFKNLVTNIASNQVSYKFMEFPMPSAQIEKILPFEMEDSLPFSIDEMLVSHHLLHYEKPMSNILASAMRKDRMLKHVECLEGIDLSPTMVAGDASELLNAFYLNTEQSFEEHFAILHMGHRSSYLIFVDKGQMRFIRSSFFGGYQITNQVRKQLDLTLEQAIEVKHNHGIIEMPDKPLRSEDLKKLSKAVVESFAPFITQTQQNIALYKASNPSDTPCQHIYLSGGTALIKNIAPYLEQQLGMHCQRIALLHAGSQEPDQHTGSHKVAHDPVFTTAIALGQKIAAKGAAAKKVSRIDYRKGDFAFAKDMSGIGNVAMFFGKWLTAVFCIAMLFQVTRYIQLKQQYKSTEKIALRQFKRLLPDSKKKPKTSSSALRTIKKELGKFEDKEKILTAGLGEETSLGVLKTISDLISPDIAMDTRELSIDNNKITLRAIANNFQDVDRIVSALKSHKKFENIDLGERKEAPNNKIAFNLTITVEDKNKKKKKRKKSRRKRS